MMDKKDLLALIDKIDSLPFESKSLDQLKDKINLLDSFISKIKEVPPGDADTIVLEVLENVNVNVISLTHSLEYVRGELALLERIELNSVIEKLSRIGFMFLSISKVYFSVFGDKYLRALHASKALVAYDKNLIESLDFEIRVITHRLRE
ncbi:MAG: hypothetical protein AAFN93_25280 [Bacteroidota bacterium]